ncbi:fused MFS/spermidine synthase [archaeon]|jgi:spermidine synthase|nr:fused MFS/spermidine synthase [archaeon]
MKIDNNISKFYLYLTAFIIGAVILTLEILGTRIIAPYYGTTIYVWSSLIAVTLTALALGYFAGGQLADRKLDTNLFYKIISLAALLIIIIPIIQNLVLVNTNGLGSRFGSLVSTVLLFGAPLALLGMVAPYAIKLKTKRLGDMGSSAGNLYGVSTLGSVLGAIAAGFYLIPNMGINSIIYLSGGILILLSLGWFVYNNKKSFGGGILILFLLISSMNLLVAQPTLDDGINIVYETESAYSKLQVVDMGSMRYLLVNGGTQASLDLRDGSFNYEYLGLFEDAVELHPNPEEILFIGLGGGGMDSILKDYGVEIDNVELDRKIVDIARDYFDFEGNVIVDEGRHYIRNTDKKYDIVFLDAFNGYSIYPYIFSLESFTEIKETLKNEDGIVAINIVGYYNDDLFKSIHSTLDEVFENVYVSYTDDDFGNNVFYATDSNLNLTKINVNNGIIITDDYNPIESLAVKTIEKWRNVDVKIFDGLILQ